MERWMGWEKGMEGEKDEHRRERGKDEVRQGREGGRRGRRGRSGKGRRQEEFGLEPPPPPPPQDVPLHKPTAFIRENKLKGFRCFSPAPCSCTGAS